MKAREMRGRVLDIDSRITLWMARNGVFLTRIALGAIFLWFGILKFFAPQGEIEGLAAQTISKLSAGHIGPSVSLPILGTWESLIGLGLLSGKFLRATILLLFLQIPGTFMPLFLFPAQAWVHVPYEPTLVGQYIIKNVVLVCAGLLVGATLRGGKIIADPHAAKKADPTPHSL